MDQVLHDFFQSLADDGILNCVNIVVTSDHGMITMSEAAKVEKVEDYVFFGSPVSKIYRNQTGISFFLHIFRMLTRKVLFSEKEGDLEISKAYALLSEMGIIPPTGQSAALFPSWLGLKATVAKIYMKFALQCLEKASRNLIFQTTRTARRSVTRITSGSTSQRMPAVRLDFTIPAVESMATL